MRDKVTIPFNPDTMTLSDAKRCVQALRGILQEYQRNPDDWEAAGRAVAQVADSYEV